LQNQIGQLPPLSVAAENQVLLLRRFSTWAPSTAAPFGKRAVKYRSDGRKQFLAGFKSLQQSCRV